MPVPGNAGVRRARGYGTGNRVCGRVQYGCGVEDTGNGVWGGGYGGHRLPDSRLENRLDRRSFGDGTGNGVGVGVGCRRVRGGTRLIRIWSGNGGMCE